MVDERLKVDGTDNIFALGDCTFTKYPPTAQVAFQEGEYLANYFDKLHAVESLKYTIANPTPKDNVEKLSRKLARLEKNLPHFIYNYQGSLAYIGSEKAVADLVWGDWSNISSGGNLTFYSGDQLIFTCVYQSRTKC